MDKTDPAPASGGADSADHNSGEQASGQAPPVTVESKPPPEDLGDGEWVPV